MKVSGSGNSDYVQELVEGGSYPGRCIRVVNMGTHENIYKGEVKPDVLKVMLSFEINEPMESGKPFCFNRKYTASISENAHLGKHLKKWRGKAFTQDELDDFDLNSIIGIPCMVELITKVGKDGKTRNEIVDISRIPKGLEANAQVNESFLFEIDEINNVEKLKLLWGLERWNIQRSREFVKAGLTMPEKEKKEDKEHDPVIDDEIVPF